MSALCVLIWALVMHVFVDQQDQLTNGNETIIASSPSASMDDVVGGNNGSESSSPSAGGGGGVTTANIAAADRDKCWRGYSNYDYMWIITGPMTMALFVRV